MRADADRIAAEIASESARGRIGTTMGDSTHIDQGPHPGLLELQQRSQRRTSNKLHRQARRLSSSVGRAADAQSMLDRAEGERNEAAGELDLMPELPEQPALGVGVTRNRTVWPLLFAVLIPLEAMLTYRQLLVLGMTDEQTMAFAALIGISLVVVAEVIGLLVHYTFTRAREREGNRPFYWMVTGLAVATLCVSVVTLNQLAGARENNQRIVEARTKRAEDAAKALATTGYLSQPGAQSPAAAAGSTGEQSDQSRIDLSWTFGLQFLVLLAAIGVSLRKRMADEYNHAVIDRRHRSRRARMAELGVRRAVRRVARSNSRLEDAMRKMRSTVQDERAFLLELFQRTIDGVRRAGSDAVVVLPELVDVETAIDEAISPRFTEVGQPTITNVPEGEPPPEPVPPPRRMPRQPTSPPVDPYLYPPPRAPYGSSPSTEPYRGTPADHGWDAPGTTGGWRAEDEPTRRLDERPGDVDIPTVPQPSSGAAERNVPREQAPERSDRPAWSEHDQVPNGTNPTGATGVRAADPQQPPSEFDGQPHQPQSELEDEQSPDGGGAVPAAPPSGPGPATAAGHDAAASQESMRPISEPVMALAANPTPMPNSPLGVPGSIDPSSPYLDALARVRAATMGRHP